MDFWHWLTLFNVAALAVLWGVYHYALRVKDEHIKELQGLVFALETLCGIQREVSARRHESEVG